MLHHDGATPLGRCTFQDHVGASENKAVGYNLRMIDSRTLDELIGAVARVLPRTPADLERNMRAALAGVCQRLDLVTREELDVQAALLARTRERLVQLEQQVSALERQLPQKKP